MSPCRHTTLWAAGKRTCLLCGRIPVQWEGASEAASRSALQWLRENGLLPASYGPVRSFHVEHDLPPPPVPRGLLPGSPRHSDGALSEPVRPARPSGMTGMTDTEVWLYWATESWLEKDVASETGLPPDMCISMWREIDRVRALFRASIQLVRLPSLSRHRVPLLSGDERGISLHPDRGRVRYSRPMRFRNRFTATPSILADGDTPEDVSR